MRHLLLYSALLSITLSSQAPAQNGATTTLTANPTTITVGGSVGFSATVLPNDKTVSPTGAVTFLDGTTSLSSSPVALVANGYTSETFPQTFGTTDASLTVAGELVGDLNGDGVQDLLIYGLPAPFSLQTFMSNGKGSYKASALQALTFSSCTTNTYVVGSPQLVDLNGDGKTDILCGSLVAYGNGDGTFAQPVSVSFLSSGFYTAYAADLNGDGKTDILAVPSTGDPESGLGGQFAMTTFLNQGGGTFAQGGTFPVAPVTGGLYVSFVPPVAVDLNGDGKLDLITQIQTFGPAQSTGIQTVDALLNQGDGTFGTYMPVTIADGPNVGPNAEFPFGMASGDVNGDGKPDLILTVSDIESNLDAIVLLGKGDGTFQAASYFIVHQLEDAQGIPYFQTPSLVIEDLNSDGKQDLIFSNGQVGLGKGDGTFVLSSPLFPLQTGVTNSAAYSAFPLGQLTLQGNLAPSFVYLLPTATPPAASVFTPQTSSSASLSLTTLSAGTHTITAHYSGDASYSAGSSTGVVVTVNQAASGTAATSSANPSFAGQSVTLTTNVTSSGPTPTGNVVFSSGSSTLATVALSGGSASYTTSSFTTPGTQTITASYAGDANTQSSSTTLNQVVNSAIAINPPDNGSTMLTVEAGKVVTASINVSGATGFSGPVTFACSGLPVNSSCSFSPATVTVSGTAPVSTQLSISTAASTSTAASLQGHGQGWGIGTASGLGLAGLMLLWPVKRKRAHMWLAMICAIAVASMGMTGCGGGSSATPKTTKGTYSFTVTASSAKVQTQSSYTLVVQ